MSQYPFDNIEQRNKVGDFFDPHEATDYADLPRMGDPLYALYDGVVDSINPKNGEIFCKNDQPIPILPPFVLVPTRILDVAKYGYLHCSEILVKKGDKIKKGQIIAKVGNTGRSSGTHLHLHMENSSKDVIDPEWVIGSWLLWGNVDDLNNQVSTLKAQLAQTSGAELSQVKQQLIETTKKLDEVKNNLTEMTNKNTEQEKLIRNSQKAHIEQLEVLRLEKQQYIDKTTQLSQVIENTDKNFKDQIEDLALKLKECQESRVAEIDIRDLPIHKLISALIFKFTKLWKTK